MLTNVRYADDWMLYARGDIDLANVVASLVWEVSIVRLRPPARCVPRPLLHHWKLAIYVVSILKKTFATIEMLPIKRSMIMINVDAVVRLFWTQGREPKKLRLQMWGHKSLHFRLCRSAKTKTSQKVPTMHLCPVRSPEKYFASYIFQCLVLSFFTLCVLGKCYTILLVH